MEERLLIVGMEVERTPQGSLRVLADRAGPVFERTGSGRIRPWQPQLIEGSNGVEVVEPNIEPRQLFPVEEAPSDDEILGEDLGRDLQDSGSESEDENLTLEDLQNILQDEEPVEEEEPSVSQNFDWSEDFSSFHGEPENFQEQTGPKIEGTRPVDLFTQIWDQNIMGSICRETNKYAWYNIVKASERGISTRSRLNQWVETSTTELYRLVSVFIFMGICYRGRIDEYWSTGILGMPLFRKLMTIDRFWLLMRFLHFVDNDFITPSTRGDERKIAKIKPLVDYLNLKFPEIYAPRKELSIDESLLLWKGRLSWVQCIRTKAARFGIKTYELCEAVTGYCLKFIIYTGKGTTASLPLFGFTSSTAKIVLNLIKDYLGKGYTLFMDNFYNSVALSRFLKQNKTDVVGTLNRRRTDTPRDIKNLNERRVPRGAVTSRHCGDVSVVSWKDVRLVTTISTYHNADMVPGRRAGENILKPSAVNTYNQFMGGVDLKDQKLATYLLERKRGMKWYIKVFRRLLNVSILNCYVIYCANIEQQPRPRQRKMTHRQFRYKLAEELYQQFGEDARTRMRRSRPEEGPTSRRLDTTLIHHPMHRETEEERTNKKKERYVRGRCVRCAARKIRTATNIICGVCDVFLCVGQCWLDYHAQENVNA